MNNPPKIRLGGRGQNQREAWEFQQLRWGSGSLGQVLFPFWFGGSGCSVLWCYFPYLRWLRSLFCSRRSVLKILCGQSSDSKCPTVSQHGAVMTSLLARWSRVVQGLTEQGSNTWAYHNHLEALFKQSSGPTCKVFDLIRSGWGPRVCISLKFLSDCCWSGHHTLEL